MNSIKLPLISALMLIASGSLAQEQKLQTFGMTKNMTCVEEGLANLTAKESHWNHLETIQGKGDAEGARMDIYLSEEGSVYVWETIRGLTCFSFFGGFNLDKKNSF